jgi:hypothetical protein
MANKSIKEESYYKNFQKYLNEAEYTVTNLSKQTSFTKDKNEALDIANQLASGDLEAPIHKNKVMEGKDDQGKPIAPPTPEVAKEWVTKIGGPEELVNRIVVIGSKIPTQGLAKKDMPFLPGPKDAAGSVDDVIDALSPGGKYNADVVSSKIATPKPNEVGGSGGNPDEKGMTYMMSGTKDGDPKDDNVTVNKDPQIAASAAIPTQTNILLGKSLAMAINGVVGGNLGAYFSTKGEILDGHHRWAATMLNDPGANITGYAAVDLDAMGGKIPALQKLTAIGNALGNKTKTESTIKNLRNQMIKLKEDHKREKAILLGESALKKSKKK